MTSKKYCPWASSRIAQGLIDKLRYDATLFFLFHNLLHGDLLPARPLGCGCPSASHAPVARPAHGRPAPRTSSVRFLFSATQRGYDNSLNLLRIGSRCAASPTPPSAPPSLFRGQEPTTAPASAASPPSPLQLSTRPPKSRPRTPGSQPPARLLRIGPATLLSSPPPPPPHYSAGKL